MNRIITTPGTPEWLATVVEDIIDPEREIIDPHHHLWRRDGYDYLLDDLWADTDSGHRITATVFVECRAEYRTSGPEHLRCVGETEFVAGVAQESRTRNSGQQAVIAGIVGHADLTQPELLDGVLDAHRAAGKGLFRGIRHAGARDPHPEALTIPGRAPEGLYGRSDFRRGLVRLGELGYTYDTWHYHHQNAAFAELARAVPGTTLIPPPTASSDSKAKRANRSTQSRKERLSSIIEPPATWAGSERSKRKTGHPPAPTPTPAPTSQPGPPRP